MDLKSHVLKQKIMRRVLIALTPQGRQLVENVTRRRLGEIGRILAEAAPQAREKIMASMLAFAEASGEPAAEDLAALGM
jgi:DNA-binding MarR family transcriptional regulator